MSQTKTSAPVNPAFYTNAMTASYDAFISHSSKDKLYADQVVRALESKGVRCWIAPRDIVPGHKYGEAIVEGIANCKIMVLIFSQHANESPQVEREVERAVHNKLQIVPFRIENVTPAKSLEYFLSAPHWLDAFSSPVDHHLEYLFNTVNLLLERTSSIPKASVPIRPPSRRRGIILGTALICCTAMAAAAFLIPRSAPVPSPVDAVLHGKWQFEVPGAGFIIHQQIEDDGKYSSTTVVEESGTQSRTDTSIRLVPDSGSERTVAWEATGTGSIHSALVPNAIVQLAIASAPNQNARAQIRNIFDDAIWTKGAAGKSGSTVYQFKPQIPGQDWQMTLEIGPERYEFRAALSDHGMYRAQNGKWTAVSQSNLSQSGGYEIMDEDTVSFSTSIGNYIWKRER